MHKSVVIITGASRGIGRCLAETLGTAGMTVVATARSVDDLADVPASLKLVMDVTNIASIQAAVDQVASTYGRVDVLVNNAGIGQRGAIEDVSEAEVQHSFDVNVYGPLRLIRAVVPIMRRQRSGRIINVSSVVSQMGIPLMGVYCATKSALETLSDSLRIELAPFGIDVVLVEPGLIATNFSSRAQTLSERVRTDTLSAYSPIYQGGMGFNAAANGRAANPLVVAEVIQKAINAPHPKPRYQAPSHARWIWRLWPMFHGLGEYILTHRLQNALTKPKK